MSGSKGSELMSLVVYGNYASGLPFLPAHHREISPREVTESHDPLSHSPTEASTQDSQQWREFSVSPLNVHCLSRCALTQAGYQIYSDIEDLKSYVSECDVDEEGRPFRSELQFSGLRPDKLWLDVSVVEGEGDTMTVEARPRKSESAQNTIGVRGQYPKREVWELCDELEDLADEIASKETGKCDRKRHAKKR